MEAYIQGDWIQAQGSFFRCRELYGQMGISFKQFGWLTRMLELMEKSKATAPEGWSGAFDWDKKPTPPDLTDIDYGAYSEEEEDK